MCYYFFRIIRSLFSEFRKMKQTQGNNSNSDEQKESQDSRNVRQRSSSTEDDSDDKIVNFLSDVIGEDVQSEMLREFTNSDEFADILEALTTSVPLNQGCRRSSTELLGIENEASSTVETDHDQSTNPMVVDSLSDNLNRGATCESINDVDRADCLSNASTAIHSPARSANAKEPTTTALTLDEEEGPPTSKVSSSIQNSELYRSSKMKWQKSDLYGALKVPKNVLVQKCSLLLCDLVYGGKYFCLDARRKDKEVKPTIQFNEPRIKEWYALENKKLDEFKSNSAKMSKCPKVLLPKTSENGDAKTGDIANSKREKLTGVSDPKLRDAKPNQAPVFTSTKEVPSSSKTKKSSNTEINISFEPEKIGSTKKSSQKIIDTSINSTDANSKQPCVVSQEQECKENMDFVKDVSSGEILKLVKSITPFANVKSIEPRELSTKETEAENNTELLNAPSLSGNPNEQYREVPSPVAAETDMEHRSPSPIVPSPPNSSNSSPQKVVKLNTSKNAHKPLAILDLSSSNSSDSEDFNINACRKKKFDKDSKAAIGRQRSSEDYRQRKFDKLENERQRKFHEKCKVSQKEVFPSASDLCDPTKEKAFDRSFR